MFLLNITIVISKIIIADNQHNNLVWSDEFDSNGVPNLNWKPDIGGNIDIEK